MSDQQQPTTTQQALTPCDELAIAQQQCAAAEKKYEDGPLRRLSTVGIIGGIGSFNTLMATGLFSTTLSTTVIGGLVGGLLAAGFLSSLVVVMMRDEKLEKAQTAARAHVADIKNAML